jgi:hypothetical protein
VRGAACKEAAGGGGRAEWQAFEGEGGFYGRDSMHTSSPSAAAARCTNVIAYLVKVCTVRMGRPCFCGCCHVKMDGILTALACLAVVSRVNVEPSTAHTTNTSHSSMLEILQKRKCKKRAGGGGQGHVRSEADVAKQNKKNGQRLVKSRKVREGVKCVYNGENHTNKWGTVDCRSYPASMRQALG